jgi:uncharacterized membrane protein
MSNTRDLFHKVSYLQYPLMIVALYYAFKPYIVGFDTIWENYNFMLIFAGLGVSLSTLQDTTKTQNKISKRIWENPTKGKMMLVLIAITAVFLILTGLFGIYAATNEIIQQIAIGTIVFGIGLIGMLKAAMEMFENHRLDKNPRQTAIPNP